jgi:hypothetical protein
MKQELTKREKILFFSMLVIAVIYVSVQFGILPMYNRYLDNVTERHRLQEDKVNVDYSIAGKPSVIEFYNTASERYAAAKADYPLLVPTDVVHTILTDLCWSSRLGVGSLRMNVLNDASDSSYDEEEGSPPPVFATVNAVMEVVGTPAALMSLLDAVDKITHIRVTNSTYIVFRTRDAEILDLGEITIHFELMYLNQ